MYFDELATEAARCEEPLNVLALEELRIELNSMQSAIDILAMLGIEESLPIDKVQAATSLTNSARECTREFNELVQQAQAFDRADQLGDMEIASIQDKATTLFCTAQFLRFQLTALQKYARSKSRRIVPYLGEKSKVLH